MLPQCPRCSAALPPAPEPTGDESFHACDCPGCGLRIETSRTVEVRSATLDAAMPLGRWAPRRGKRLGVGIGVTAGNAGAQQMLAALLDARGDIRASGVSDLEQHAAPAEIPPADPANPPPGAWHHNDGLTVEFGASTRGFCAFLGVFILAALWNAVTWGVAAMGVRGILIQWGVIERGAGDAGPAGLVGSIMVLLSLPFAFIGVHLLWTAAMYAAGKLTVTRRGDDLALFTGIGPFGRTRRLSASAIASVEEHVKISRGKHGVTATRTACIRLRDGSELKAGDLLNPERRAWMIGMLRRLAMG